MTSDPTPPSAAIQPDDPSRAHRRSTQPGPGSAPTSALVGDTYTILVSGADTAGRYTLIDMHVPSGGGPPPHRHDFEEMFSVLEGEVKVTFRGETLTTSRRRDDQRASQCPACLHERRWHAPRDRCASAPPPAKTSSSPWSDSRCRPRTRSRLRPSTPQHKQPLWRRRRTSPRCYRTELLPPPGAE